MENRVGKPSTIGGNKEKKKQTNKQNKQNIKSKTKLVRDYSAK